MSNRPRGPPEPWTQVHLIKHLQTAVAVELCTIPVYLSALYAIDDTGTDDQKKIAKGAARKILGVVKEEMLHLGLAGNILCSIGIMPELYGPKTTPEYPFKMLYDRIELNLMQPDNDAIKMLVKIEAPFRPPQHRKGPGEIDRYRSIGKFYTELKKGIETVHKEMEDQEKALFDSQYQDRQLIWTSYGGKMIPIKTLEDALKAMTLIVEQGEGSTIKGSKKGSHYDTFMKLKNVEIPRYNTVANPKTNSNDPMFSDKIKKVMRAFDAVYCYLLLSIENVWADVTDEGREQLLNNIGTLMGGIMRPIARFLVKEKLEGNSGTPKYAAPPFNYYPFESIKSAREAMIGELEAANAAYDGRPFSRELEQAKGLFDLKDLKTKIEREEEEEEGKEGEEEEEDEEEGKGDEDNDEK